MSELDLRGRLLEGLRGRVFELTQWQGTNNWTHDHCEACNARLCEHPLEGDFSQGYVTYTSAANCDPPAMAPGWTILAQPVDDRGAKTWICPPCFERFQHRHGWLLHSA